MEQINVAGNSFSSSILPMESLHLDCAPESRYIGKESIEVKTLDSVFHEICRPDANVYLKVDTQGFEEKVLEGAKHSLPKIAAVQLEMSISRMYSGELLIADMINLMRDKGYTLVSLEDGFCDPNFWQAATSRWHIHAIASIANSGGSACLNSFRRAVRTQEFRHPPDRRQKTDTALTPRPIRPHASRRDTPPERSPRRADRGIASPIRPMQTPERQQQHS